MNFMMSSKSPVGLKRGIQKTLSRVAKIDEGGDRRPRHTMSTEVIQELCRNIETTLHDRLTVIQDILKTTKQSSLTGDSSAVQAKLIELEHHITNVDEYAMGEVRSLAYNHDQLEKRVELLESSMRKAAETLLTLNHTIGFLQKRIDDERPVEAVEAEVEVEETQEAALNADADAVATEAKAKESMTRAVEELEDEGDDVDDEEEEEEEEEQEEEEELDLESFTYKKKTYARDQNNNVYNLDEEGSADVSEVVGIWNPTTKKIDPVPQEEEVPELEAFDYQKKTYCRDSENNVYSVDADGCADVSEIIGLWNPKTKKIERVPQA